MNKLLSSIILLEGITHIEDLSLKEFIRTIETLKNKIVTEKLDGANLWFGVDEDGRVFTSREGKSPKSSRFYKISDYPMVANYNAFRATHLAIEKMAPQITKILQPNDMIEIEVLFGRQPNTVTYGVSKKNFIVILRGVNQTPDERVKQLSQALDNKQVTVKSTIVNSPDGEKLEFVNEDMLWEFTDVKPMDAKKIDTKEVASLLAQMKKYLAQNNKVLTNSTNEEVAELVLSSVPKEKRDEAKAERDRVQAYIMNEFKLPIKELLLNNFVRKIKPSLQDADLHPSEDIGVEGVVVRDPVSGSQTKIVDKDVFTAINTFNSSVRASVSGLVRTTDQDAAMEMRGGVFGQAKIRIAELLGAKELAMSSGVKRFITKFKANTAIETADALAKSLNISNFIDVRTKISAILTSTVKDVNAILQQFKQEAGEYRLKLKTGKEIGITPEVMKRTLTAFAETKKDIAEINSKVRSSKTPTDLVLALYGRTIDSLFDGESVKESMKNQFTLIRSISEEGEGGEGAGPTATPATSTTSSAAIAPYAKQLFGQRRIIKRARNFTAPKKFPSPDSMKKEGKFSILRSINEDWAHVNDMKFATDVDDTAQAKNDVDFKQLRNNVAIGADVTQMDINNYLNKAHELNDEVDTVIFGMETDDGKVVKVYVNATQADTFETALAELLGQMDDVEQVINDLAQKFDIVDVEWPESMGDNTSDDMDDTVDGDQMADSDSDSDSDSLDEPADEIQLDADGTSEENEEGESEIDLSISGEDESSEENADDSKNDDLSDEDTSDDNLSDDSVEDTDEDTADDDTSSEDESADESADDIDDESAEEEDEFGQPIKKKRKKRSDTTDEEPAMEESMNTYGQKIKQRLLNEASSKQANKKKKEVEEDPLVAAAKAKHAGQIEDLLNAFPTRQDKAIVSMMITLGAPIKALTLHKAQARKSIDGAAEKYLKNSAFRMWARKLLDAINQKEGAVAEQSTFEKRLSTKYQHIIYGILKALGLPDAVETTSSRQLANGIRAKADLVNTDTDIRVYLLAVAEQLGVNTSNINAPETKVAEGEQLVLENAEEAFNSVMKLLTTLGFDPATTRSINNQAARQQVKTPLLKLAANPTLLRRLDTLTDLISQRVTTNAPGQQAPQFSHVERVGNTITEKVDSNKWIMATMGKTGGLMLKCAGKTIKIDGDEAEKLSFGLDKNVKSISMLDTKGDRYILTRAKHGYAVQKPDDDSFPADLHLLKTDVAELLELLNG